MVRANIDPTQFPFLSLEERDEKGKTPLHVAAEEESLKCLSSLINKLGSSKLDPSDHFGRTPLFYAIEKRRRNFVKALIKSGANINHLDLNGISPFSSGLCGRK